MALRLLLRKPSYAIPILLCLTLGTAATVTATSLVSSLVWPNSPYPDAASLFEVYEDHLSVTASDHDRFISEQTRLDFADRVGLSHSAGVRTAAPFAKVSDVASCGSPIVATGDFFSVLSITPLQGRLFTRLDESTVAARPIVITSECWLKAFGGEQSVVGRSFTGRGETYTIIGILPSAFRFPIQSPAQVFVLATSAEKDLGFDFSLTRITAENLPRARAAASFVERSRGPVDQAALRERSRSPAIRTTTTSRPRLVVHPYHGEPLDETSQRLVGLILFCVFLVVLVTISNAATLFSARMGDRGRDFATRMALGASPIEILISILAEGYTFVILAGILGGILSLTALKIIGATLPLAHVNVEIGVGLIPYCATVGSIGLLWSIYGAIAGSGASKSLLLALRTSETASTATPRVLQVQRRAVTAQIAITIGVVSAWMLAAVEFFSSANQLRDTTRGIAVVTLSHSPERTSLQDGSNSAHAMRQTYDNFKRMGFAVAVGQHPARAQIQLRQIRLARGAVTSHLVWLAGTSSAYGQLLHERVLRGRSFTEAEERDGAPVAVVDPLAAAALFGGDDPIGRRFEIADAGSGITLTVIGIGSGLNAFRSISGTTSAFEIRVPWTALKEEPDGLIVATSNSGTTMATAASLAAPAGTLLRIERAEDLVVGRGALQKLLTQLFTMFGCAALGLASVGAYSLMAMTAVQLRRIVAIRMALGARPRTMIWWLLRRHIGPISIGFLLGGLLTALAAVAAIKTGMIAANRVKPLIVLLPVITTVAVLIVVSLLPARTVVARPIMETLRHD